MDMTTNKKKPETTSEKPKKLSGHKQVVEFLNNLEHPLKKEIEEVRQIILSANPHINERIKWKAPSFCIEDEDRVTFNLHGRGYFQLVFHCGAKVKENSGKVPLFDDTTELLDWITGDRAIVKFADMNDVKAKKVKLAEVINKWIEVTTIE
jgi:hypothetical protein